jgi:OmcA/MtrC family decaheme c-type cytochrome
MKTSRIIAMTALVAVLILIMGLSTACGPMPTPTSAPTVAPTAAPRPPEPTKIVEPTKAPVTGLSIPAPAATVPAAAAPASVAPGSGIKMQITKVEIPADNKPVVTFRVTDAQGNLLKNANLDTNSFRFAIAKVVTDKASGLTSYESFITRTVTGGTYTWYTQTLKAALPTAIQATADSGGKLTETDAGMTYVFTNTLPANYDKAATLVVGGQTSRNARADVANATFGFVPAGGTPTIREVVKTEACGTCHDPLVVHGARTEVAYCVLCHSQQSTDVNSGNTVDMKVMVHKIHRGGALPSVAAGKPYFIASSSADFSGAAFPEDNRNCTTCHQPGAKNADNWKTAPSAAACGSCHDNVDFKTGANHKAGAQANDAACKSCHPADSGKEFDASVVGAHVIPNDSKQLRGVKFAVVSVSDSKPGQNPTVTFNIKDKDGKAIDPKDFNSLSLALAGPTTDYANRWTESLVISATVSSRAKDAGNGNFTYTFTNTIPTDAKGSYAVSIQGYINTQLKRADGTPLLGADGKTPLVVRDVGYNPIFPVAVTDARPVARRSIVEVADCNTCHRAIGSPAGLSIHGGARQNPDYCAFCHNSTLTDEGRRTDGSAPVSLELDSMIHGIHASEMRAEPFVFGSGTSAVSFAKVVYPGNLAKCEDCHAAGTYVLPLKTTQPLTIKQKGAVVSVTQPVAALCSTCHDSAAAKGHFTLNTANGTTETCVVCHGEGKDISVSSAHKK